MAQLPEEERLDALTKPPQRKPATPKPQPTSYGTKGHVIPWTGQLSGNDTMLRFASADGKSVYDLQCNGATKMEGRVSYDSGYGRLLLVRQ